MNRYSVSPQSARIGERLRGAMLASGVSLLALSASLDSGSAFAAGATPSGGQFAAGAGAIAPTANGLAITQSTSRGIINWQSFSIGQGNAVNINNGSGATLNRVTGGDISNIAGSLTSTGSVYLVNPAGVVVMPTGQVVTTGNFVASTRDVTDGNFLAGGAQNFKGASAGTVVNQGSITSTNGDVILVGKSVTNSGQISAANGTVGLAAGDDVLLQPTSDQQILINAGTGDVTNTGTLKAAQAELAAAGGNVYALATNNGGVIRATGSATKNGRVYLTAGGNVTIDGAVSATNADGSGGQVTATAGATTGMLSVTGTVSTSATSMSAKGGTAKLTANTVNVGSTAKISADGGTDGGNVFIGGDRHGGTDPTVALSTTPIVNANYTNVAAGAKISADGGAAIAGGSGDGGNVVVWSDKSTSFAGAISAQGGALGGNGGFVEVSGEQLSFTGTVTTLASLGTAGTLLLDPSDVTIVTATDNSGGPVVTTNESAGPTYNPTTGTSTILNTDITTALATNNVVVNSGSLGDGLTGTGSIHIGTSGNAVAITWNSAFGLTLNAVGIIAFDGGNPGGGYAIDSQGSGSITLISASNGVTPIANKSGAGGILLNGSIRANGGTITLVASKLNTDIDIANGYSIVNQNSGNISLIADHVRTGGVGSGPTGTIVDSTGSVFIQPTQGSSYDSSGTVVSPNIVVGNNSPTGNRITYNSNNSALIDDADFANITAKNLILGSMTTASISVTTVVTPSNRGAKILAPNVNNVELLTGTTATTSAGSTISVSQDAYTPIVVSGGAGGLAVVTGGPVYLPDFLNQVSTLAINAGGSVVFQGNSTNDNTGTLAINTVNGISGIKSPGNSVTLINVGSTTQDTTAANVVTASNLVLEGGATGNYTSYNPYTAGVVQLTPTNYTGTFNGSYALNNLANAVSNVAASVSSLSLTNNTALTIANLSDNLTAATTGSGNSITSTSISGLTGTGNLSVVNYGVLTLANLGAGAITTTGGSVTLEDGSPSYGTVAANTGFINQDTSPTPISVTGGTWRIYSQDPRNDVDGTLDNTTNASFVQYGAANYYGAPTANGNGTSGSPSPFTYANSKLNGAATGNGFLYTVLPTVTETGTANLTKVYDGNSNYNGGVGSTTLTYSSPTGAINGDTVSLTTPTVPNTNLYQGNVNVGTYTALTISGVTLNTTASATHDANNVTAYGYTVSPTPTYTAAITKAPLTVTGTKVYDTNTGFATNQLTVTGAVNSETVSLTAGSGTSTSANVATYAGSTLTGLAGSVTGGNALISNYQLPTTGALTITSAPLSVIASNQSRIYGNTGGTLVLGAAQTTQFTTTGLLTGDSVTSATLTGNAASTAAITDAGTVPNAITPSAAAGTGLGNYTITYNPGNVTITQAPLTVTGTKVYDTNTGFVTNQLAVTGGVNGQTVALTAGSGTSASANIGTYNGSTLTGLTDTVSGGTGNALASNYQLPATGALTITPAPLSITASTQSRVYGNTGGTLVLGAAQTTQFTSSGLLTGASVSNVTLTGNAASTAATTTVGTLPNAITPSAAAGTGLGNYTITYNPGNVTITQAPLTVTASNQSRVYGPTGGTLVLGAAQTTQFTTIGLVNGDTVTSATLTGNAASTAALTNVGTLPNAITPSVAAGSGLSNYSISYVQGNVTVTTAPLTVTGTKSYDSTTGFVTNQLAVTGGVNGETVSLTGGTGTSSSPNVNTYPGSTLTGITVGVTGGNAAASNYAVPTTGTLTITPANITLAGGTKVYNGTTVVAAASINSLSNLQPGDSLGGDLTISGNGSTTSANVGSYTGAGSTFALGSLTLGGSAAPNYTLNAGTYTITQAPLTVTASAQSRVYGPTGGTLVLGAAQTTQFTTTGTLYGGDAVTSATLTGNAASTAATTNVGVVPSAITPSVAGGTGLSNYNISYVAGNVTITGAPLTVTGTKVYDTNTGFVTNKLAVTGGVNGETVSLTGGTGTSTSANVGAYVGSTLTGLTDSVTGGNALASNYILPGTGTLTITQAPLTVTASNQSRVYGPTTLTLGAGQTTQFGTTGLLAGASVNSVTLTGTAASTAATTGVSTLTGAITPSAAAGTGLGNYTISYVAGNASITPEPLTITANNRTKTYGTAVTFAGTEFTSTGLVNGDTVGTATLASLGAAATASVLGSPYSITAASVTGGTFTAANYSVTYVPGNLTVNTAPGIMITATNQTKVYGATGALGTTAFTTSGLAGGDTIAGVTLTSAGTPASANVNTTPGYSLIPSAETGGTYVQSNYAALPTYTNGLYTVTQAPLTVTGTKVYDTTTGFTTGKLTVTGGVNGETVALTGGTGTSGSPNVNTYPGSTLTAITVGVTGGNALASNYSVPTTGTLTITPANVTLASGGKTYDGTTSVAAAQLTSLSGLQPGDSLGGDLSLSGTGSTSSPNAATYATYTLGSLVLGGTAAGNYQLSAGTFTVSPATVSITGSKVYNGSTAAAASTFSGTLAGVLGNDAANVALAGSGTLGSPNAGSYSSSGTGVTALPLTGLSLTGSAAGNYTLASDTYTVTAAPAITITATPQNKTYGTTAALGTTGFTTAGLVGSDTVAAVTLTSTGAPSPANAGIYALAPSAETGGTYLQSNYAALPNYVNSILTVNPATLTVTGTKVYDSTTGFTSNKLAVTGGVNGEIVALTAGTGTSSSPNVSTYPGSTLTGIAVSVTGGNALASNYTVPTIGTLTITPAPITLASGGKTYDGTNSVAASQLNSLSGLQPGDSLGGDLTLSGTGSTASPNAGTYGTYTLGNLVLGGSAAANYQLSPGTFTISPLTISIAGTKVYDTTTGFAVGQLVATGGVSGETVTLTSGTGTSSAPNVATYAGSPLTGLAIAVAGGNALASNYNLPGAGTLTITPAQLTVTGTKVYDKTTGFTTTQLAVTGGVGRQTVTLTGGTGTSTAPDVGSYAGSPLTGVSLAVNGGSPSNYGVPTSGTLTITPLAVRLVGTRPYDGQTDGNAPILSVNNGISGDPVSVATGVSTVASKNVGPETIVDFGTLTLGNNPFGDYTLVGATGVVTITPLRLTVTAVPTTKTYDGTPGSPGTPVITVGALQGPDIGNFTESYGNKNAGTGLTLTPTGSVADGFGGNNYIVTYVPISSGVINPRPVVLIGTRPFDNTTGAVAPILSFTNDIDGGNLTVAGNGTLITPAVGTEQIVNFTGLTLGGSALGNYTLVGASGQVLITPADQPAIPPVTLNQTVALPAAPISSVAGIIFLTPNQNGIVTGTVATVDGQAVGSDVKTGCTMGATGCLQDGNAPSPQPDMGNRDFTPSNTPTPVLDGTVVLPDNVPLPSANNAADPTANIAASK